MKKVYFPFLFLAGTILSFSSLALATKRPPEYAAESYSGVNSPDAKRSKTAPSSNTTPDSEAESEYEYLADASENSDTETESSNSESDDDSDDLGTEQQDIDIDAWVKKQLYPDEFSDIANKFINLMLNTFESSPWLYNDTPTKEADTIKSKSAEVFDNIQYNFPILPYFVKWILPANTRVEIIGDIHANIKTTEELLHILVNKDCIDNLMNIKENVKIIFLGDLVDRGGESLKVLATAMLLAIKNPGKVLILRGNHEDYEINENYEIQAELARLNPFARTKVYNKLKMVYEVLPIELLLGYAGQTQTNLQLLVHGGPDIRLDYTDFMNFQTNKQFPHSDICFWKLTQKDLCKTSNIQEFLTDMFNIIDENVCETFQAHIQNIDLTNGSLWNDITYETKWAKNGNRGGVESMELGFDLFDVFFEQFATEKCKVVGIIRGHDHVTAKCLSGKAMNDKTETPASYMIQKSAPQLMKLNELFKLNEFSIVTIIAGSIIFPEATKAQENFLSYPSTILELMQSENSNFSVQAFSV